jgi:hypothetical protein
VRVRRFYLSRRTLIEFWEAWNSGLGVVSEKSPYQSSVTLY